jgi:predicted GNAT family N-acyltransferase
MISEYRESELNRSQFYEIVSLTNSIWPHPERSLDELVDKAMTFAQRNRSDWIRRFVIWDHSRVIAHARVFPRDIVTKNQVLSILALAGVCVSEERRGEGIGKKLIKRVFQLVDESEFPCILFQTAVPDFYRKLDSRQVFNRFVNSQNESDPECNPWWEKNIMIYPEEYPFPEGRIDLNKPGY